MLTVVISFLSALASGGTERDIVNPIMRSLVFALVPLIPGHLIRSGDGLIMRVFFACIAPAVGIVVEVSLLEGVIRSCNGQCNPALIHNPIIKQLLFFSAYDYFL